MKQTANVLHENASSAIIADQRIGDVEIVGFARSWRQIHLNSTASRSWRCVQDPYRVPGGGDTLRTAVVAQSEGGDDWEAAVGTVVDVDLGLGSWSWVGILFGHEVDEVKRQDLFVEIQSIKNEFKFNSIKFNQLKSIKSELKSNWNKLNQLKSIKSKLKSNAIN